MHSRWAETPPTLALTCLNVMICLAIAALPASALHPASGVGARRVGRVTVPHGGLLDTGRMTAHGASGDSRT